MRKLENIVQDGSWDNLIVLDSMRYDYMKEFYHIFPNLELGELEKVKSPGSATPEILPQIFDRERDWSVISAHPFIKESGGVPTRNVDAPDTWYANDYFESVTSLSENATGRPLSVVTPSEVEKVVRTSTLEGKNIIWMIQPHAPYIGSVKLSFSRFFPWDFFKDDDGNIADSLINLTRIAYKFNVLKVLSAVAHIVGEIDGETIITSDHGQLLFEESAPKQRHGHPSGSRNEILRDVPSLRVSDSANTLDLNNLTTEGYIKLAYRSVLNREVDEGGLMTYKEHIDETGKMNRASIFEVLLHSDEYKERFHNPNRICGVDAFIMGESTSKNIEGENLNKEQLRDLGYL